MIRLGVKYMKSAVSKKDFPLTLITLFNGHTAKNLKTQVLLPFSAAALIPE